MPPKWFKPRGYTHLDAQVGEQYAKRISPAYVQTHSWSPLVSYIKKIKRYKPSKNKTEYKDRLIMYASHRDACILAKYSSDLSERLERFYAASGLDKNVIAYRSLGRSNYHFAADACQFAIDNAPCVVMCFDVSGFFDTLNHKIIKSQMKRVLDVKELPKDWYSVFRHVTRFSHIERDTIAKHPTFGPRLKRRSHEPFATIKDIVVAGIKIHENANHFGIPQGTPISSTLSNLYLMDLDCAMCEACAQSGALYQRYSDDILIICKLESAPALEKVLSDQMAIHCLKLNSEKTEKILFDPATPKTFQYLGFNISPDGAVIRPGSLSRQWRKAKRSIARTKMIAAKAISAGKADKVFTKKLRRRFTPVGVRNFSSYARRSADAFGSPKILRQVRRLERRMDDAIRDLKTPP